MKGRKPRGQLQQIYDREQLPDEAPVNPFAAQHGDYQPRGKYNGAGKMMVNVGGTPVARWKKAKLLTDQQLSAIEHCERLWARLNGRKLVANLMGISGGEPNEWGEQEALNSLARIKGYFPPKWWSVFESVCRFDEPAGYAGSRLTSSPNDQSTAARITVQMVADTIALKEHLSY